MALKVVVDASALGDGSAVRGIGAVLRPLIDGLAARSDMELVLLGPVGPRWPEGTEHRPIAMHGPGRWRPWEHLAVSGVAARRVHADVAWFPANLPPLLPPHPFVATVHDVIPLQLGGPGLAADRRRWRTFGRGLRRARAVLCPSWATAHAAHAALGLDPRHTEVIPWGVGEAFTPAGATEGVGFPHLLWVSAFDAHKGLAEACELVATLSTRGLPHHLRLVGPFDEWNRRLVDEIVAGSTRPDLVDVVGWVDDLPAAYRAADAFVVTSRIEGFGLPPVEAQACGTPVVGFASAAVTEVSGPGARLVPWGDLPALADVAQQVLTDPSHSSDLVVAGLANAARYTWHAAVDTYAAALHRAAEHAEPAGRTHDPPATT